MPLREYECPHGHRKTELIKGDDYPRAMPCSCGAEARSVVTAASFHVVGSHVTKDSIEGRYDPGLGRHIRSEEHRQEVMRELGVVEVGDWQPAMDDQARADSARAKKEDAVVAEMLQGFEHGPDAAALKTARDRGDVPDWSEHAATLGVT